jgi:signal transduction histidine kinase/sugar phosphate isomerase/epimerase
MNLGFQTIIFGRRLDDLDRVLLTIRAAGFEGVEFFQHHESILGSDRQPVTYKVLLEKMRDNDLELLGLSGGSLADRVLYVGDDPKPLYLYVDDLDDPENQIALEKGFTLAVHPHVFTKHERIDRVLQHPLLSNPNVFLLPDTAHLAIVGDDPVQVLRSIHLDRVIGVHLKDWVAAFGRAYNSYAKGFTELGLGNVPVDRIVKLLRDRNYRGWLIVEQDYSSRGPCHSIAANTEWLAEHRLLERPVTLDALPKPPPAEPVVEGGFAKLHDTKLNFTHDMLTAEDRHLNESYGRMAKSLQRLYAAHRVAIWSYSKERDMAYFLAAHPADEKLDCHRIVKKSESLFARTAETLEVEQHNPELALDPTFGQPWREWARANGSKQLTTIAIADKHNPHQVRLLISVLSEERPKEFYTDTLDYVEATLAHAADAALSNARSFVGGQTNQRILLEVTGERYYDALAKLISDLMPCESTSILLQNYSGDRLLPRTPDADVWSKSIPEAGRFYASDDPDIRDIATARCWTEGKTLFLQYTQREDDGRKWWSRNKVHRRYGPDVDGVVRRSDTLLVPLWSERQGSDASKASASVIGVVRCTNKGNADETANGPRLFFNDDDAAILAAICEDAAAKVELLRARERQDDMTRKMTHELNMPINTLRAAVDEIRTETKLTAASLRKSLESLSPDAYARLRNAGLIFNSEYLEDTAEDVTSWLDLMSRVIDNVGVSEKLRGPEFPLTVRPWYLKGDIIAPVKPQLRIYLAERGFSVDKITYSDFEDIGKVFVDRNRLQQVFFNLLSNAIKYAYPEPRQFRVHIGGEWHGNHYRIFCQDNGPGIEPGYETLIFEESVRGPVSLVRTVKGLGIGLWVVKRIVEEHGGRIEVTHPYQPTEFSVYLPRSLTTSPPKGHKLAKDWSAT